MNIKSTSAMISTAFATWRNRLLDLTKRNKALNYKPSRVASIEIVDEKPAIVFNYLLQGKKMKFYPVLPSNSTSSSQTFVTGPEVKDDESSTISSFDIDESFQSMEFVPYAVSELAERHVDTVLQCHCSPEKLDVSLRRLDELARLSIGEQGVNTLFLALGFLHFTENDRSSEILKAPVVLLPVKLERKTARSAFEIAASDEEPMINPTLAEYLRQNFGIVLPRLPDHYEHNSFDLLEYFKGFSTLVSEKVNWSLREDICLAHFSFQKFVMYKDIEKNEHIFSSHRLTKQLMTKTTQGGGIGLPVNIKNIDLDSEFCPEDQFLVMDADSSQLRCIAAVSRGYDLIIEGPPGTGKSQTITNLISHALSQNKTVLFVSEKMAALQVVYRRLQEAGLDEFCLQLHSVKESKKEVIENIRHSIDATLTGFPGKRDVSLKIKEVRKRLNDYTKALHRKVSPLGLSVFDVLDIFVKVQSEKSIDCPIDVMNFTNSEVCVLVEALECVSNAAQPLGEIAKHPWRDSDKTYISRSEIDTIEKECKGLLENLSLLKAKVELLSDTFDIEPVTLLSQIQDLKPLSQCLSSAPGVPLDTLQSESWDSLPLEIESTLDIGESYSTMCAKLLAKYHPVVLESYHSYDIDYVQMRVGGFKKVLRFFDSRYRGIKEKWRSYQKRKTNGSIKSIAEDLRLADKCRNERLHIETISQKITKELGSHWKGIYTDWAELRFVCMWIIQFRLLARSMQLGIKTFTVAAAGKVDTSIFEEISVTGDKVIKQLVSLCAKVGWAEDYLSNISINEIHERLRELYGNLDKASQWAVYQNAVRKVKNSSAAFCVTSIITMNIPLDRLSKIFKRAFYQKWLDIVIGDNQLLREFSTALHTQCKEQFIEMDTKVQNENRGNLISFLRQSVQERAKSSDVQRGMQFLRREFAKQRRLSPLRKTMRISEGAIQAIKPCFLMSPISVAQYLDASATLFDLVIFDEASQLPTENAIGSICRGKQLVVVGDPKQLPPTNFFVTQSGSISDSKEDSNTIIDHTESVLEDFLGSGLLSSRLRWHYRSAHESLITFSNVSFYDSDLYTFPSVMINNVSDGLHFTYVQDGCYEGNGLNRIEARRVVDKIMEHAKNRPDVSLGVGTFNMRQQLAILDELEIRRRKNPSFEKFFSQDKPEPFFVKNLENIQGDERDTIYISITYGKDKNGNIRCNFGPLNSENGWRRLNVLVTRARSCMRVFSSMRGEDINPVNPISRGPELLRDFLIFAERGRIERKKDSKTNCSLSSFELDVMNELLHNGYDIDSQVGIAGFRIDLGIRHQSLPGRYVCGISCDGTGYYLSETARDRDRLREQVLRKRGWELIHVWSVDWYKERNEQIERMLSAIEIIRKKILQNDHSTSDLLQCSRCTTVDNNSIISENKQTKLPESGHKYIRPDAVPYKIAIVKRPSIGIMDVTLEYLRGVILKIIETEAPIHYDELKDRLSFIWDQKIGPRREARIHDAIKYAVEELELVNNDGFFLKKDTVLKIRNRENVKMETCRVCKEEIQEAVVAILNSAIMIDREKLISETRCVLGLIRNKITVDTINRVIENLIEKQIVGEGSGGVALRKVYK